MANFCSNCGKSLRESARFCPYCGTKVFNVTLNNSTQSSGASSYEKDKVENGDKESKVVAGKTKWVCRICGYVHEGDEPPAICPLCKNPSTYFEKVVEATPTQASSVATKRVYQVAKELNCDEQKVIDFLKNQGIKVVNRLSVVSEDNYKLLQKKFLEDLLFGALMNGGNDSNSSSPSEKSTDIKASESNAISSIVPADEAISSPKIVEVSDELNVVELKKAGLEAEYYESWIETAQEAKAKGDNETALKFYKKAEVSLLKLAFEADRNKDIHTAINYCETAMNFGSAEAAFALGKIYSNGWMYHSCESDVKDNQKAILHFGCAVLGYHYEAAYKLSNINLPDNESAEIWISIFRKLQEKVKKEENPDDIFNLSILCRAIDTEEMKEESKSLMEWAEDLYLDLLYRGSSIAMYQRAKFFKFGFNGKEIDNEVAFRLYEMAAEAGIKEAMVEVGAAYENEFLTWFSTVPMDMDVAMYWYKKAADLGSLRAMYSIECLEKEKEKCEEIQRKAETNDPDSMCDLALMYINGKFVAKDERKALDLLLKAQSIVKLNDRVTINDGYIPYRIAEINYSLGEYTEAVRWYEESADNGNDSAIGKLAEMFREGNCVSKDEVYADNLLEIKEEFSDAHNGKIEAQYKVACRYLEGNFVKENCRRALAWFEQVVKNYIETIDVRKYKYAALYTMARLYEDGKGNVTKEPKKAESLYNKAKRFEKYKEEELIFADIRKSVNSTEATLLKQAFEAECNEDFPKAIDCYKRAMNFGSVDAAFNLGKLYAYCSDESIKNKTAAAKLFSYAHKCGYDATAELIIINPWDTWTGNDYEECRKILKELFHYLRAKVEADDNANDIFNLSELYRYELGTERSETEADKLVKIAFLKYSELARQGDPIAIRKMADFYLEGYDIVERDLDLSFKLYLQCARAGDREAMYCVGNAYSNTQGWEETVPLNMGVAMQWYKSAADLGSVKAMSTLKYYEEKRLEYEEACVGANQGNYKSMITLANMYHSGRVVTRNKKEALNLYLRAASLAKSFKSFKRNSDYGETAYRIAEIYCEGDDDVEQDYYEAKKWYGEAVEDGDFHAMEKLAEMFRTGTGGRKDSSHADYILKVKEEFFDAHAGIIEAQYKVAYRYWNGDFVKEDYNKAVAWFREIAENKNIDELDLKYKYGALYNMAILYDEGGYGLEIDKRKASLLREEAKKYEKYRSGKSNSSNTDSSKGGCFITTAACLNLGGTDDCYELTTFRFFRDNWLVNQPDGKSLIAEYYSIAPKIVDKIDSLRNAQEIYRQIWDDYLKPCLSLIEQAKYSECKLKYIDMVNYLKNLK